MERLHHKSLDFCDWFLELENFTFPPFNNGYKYLNKTKTGLTSIFSIIPTEWNSCQSC